MDPAPARRARRRGKKYKLIVVESLVTPHSSGDAARCYSYNYWQAFICAPTPASPTVDADLIDHQAELSAIRAEYDLRHLTADIARLNQDVAFLTLRNSAFAADLRTDEDAAIIKCQNEELAAAVNQLSDSLFALKHFKAVVPRDVLAHQRMVEGDILRKRLSWSDWHKSHR